MEKKFKYKFESGTGKSGPIHCDKGFKVRFDLRKPSEDKDDWSGVGVFMTDMLVPIK